LQAEYGIRLATAKDTYSVTELSDLVAYLSDGCALWQSVGGARAWSPETHMLNIVEYRLRVLDWRKTKDGSAGKNQPSLHKAPPYAHEKEAEEVQLSARAAAWEARQRRRTEQN
jgi:hypothetical protein